MREKRWRRRSEPLWLFKSLWGHLVYRKRTFYRLMSILLKVRWWYWTGQWINYYKYLKLEIHRKLRFYIGFIFYNTEVLNPSQKLTTRLIGTIIGRRTGPSRNRHKWSSFGPYFNSMSLHLTNFSFSQSWWVSIESEVVKNGFSYTEKCGLNICAWFRWTFVVE